MLANEGGVRRTDRGAGLVTVGGSGGITSASVLATGGLNTDGASLDVDSIRALDTIAGGGGPRSVGDSTISACGDIGGGLGVTSALGSSNSEHGADVAIPDQFTLTEITRPLCGNPRCMQPGRASWADAVAGGRSNSGTICGGGCDLRPCSECRWRHSFSSPRGQPRSGITKL
jgi:hypothetical protein